MRLLRAATAAVALLLCMPTSPVAAAVVTGGFSGTVFSGFDSAGGPAGYFGLGASLEDQPITGTFRYDTDRVPPGSSSGPNGVVYTDPAFATDFLSFTVTINGRSYAFGELAAPPGIQSIDVMDESDQLQFDYQRFGDDRDEVISLRFISDLDFLSGTGVPTAFSFVASGEGLTPGGVFAFSRPDGGFASASFAIDSGFAQVAKVPAPGAPALVCTGLAAWFSRRRGRAR